MWICTGAGGGYTVSITAEKLESLGKNSVELKIARKEKYKLGVTRFGGQPDVPSDFVWPIYKGKSSFDNMVKDRLLTFPAQFNCEDLAQYDTEHPLPDHGLLSFFYEQDFYIWHNLILQNPQDISPLKFGMSQDEVMEIMGKPDAVSTIRSGRKPLILKYHNIELHFDGKAHQGLYLIYSDDEMDLSITADHEERSDSYESL